NRPPPRQERWGDPGRQGTRARQEPRVVDRRPVPNLRVEVVPPNISGRSSRKGQVLSTGRPTYLILRTGVDQGRMTNGGVGAGIFFASRSPSEETRQNKVANSANESCV